MSEVEIISAFLGTIIGLILALTGAGGAMLAIPLLVFFLHLTIYQAAPIALLAVFMASTIGALQGFRKGHVRYKAAILIATIGAVIAPLGVKLAQHTSNQVLSVALISILLFISLQSWQSAATKTSDNSHLPPAACMINPLTSKLFWTAICTRRLIGTGALSGFLSGLLGVGGGFVIVPSLNKASNFNHQTIIATTLASVSIITISSVATHTQSSTMNWHIAVPFALGVTFSMLFASETLSKRVSKKTSQKAFALLCIAAAIQLAIKNII